MSTETKKRYKTKKLIHLTKEMEEKMAQQSAQKIQSFANELAQVQSRRLELTTLLLQAEVTRSGIASVTETEISKCVKVARDAIEADSLQKWTDIAALFAELEVHGPQPHLEWAAKRVGVTLFEELPEEPLIQPITTDELAKVVTEH